MGGVRGEQRAMDIPIFGRKKESCASVFALSVELMFSCEMFFRALRSRCDLIFGRFLPLSFFERERIYFGLFALEFFMARSFIVEFCESTVLALPN
jgi:aromatic ring-opening dioxygenase LigB subunit